MTLNVIIREKVRLRAENRCEYCGITETDTGGMLTIDHFQPQSKGGDDELTNLIYCCSRCNTYKHDYFSKDNEIWNPRNESSDLHFLELDNGKLKALTIIGERTINLLPLNRIPLVKYRLQNQDRNNQKRLLKQYENLISLLHQTTTELSILSKEQQLLLEKQQELLNILLKDFKK